MFFFVFCNNHHHHHHHHQRRHKFIPQIDPGIPPFFERIPCQAIVGRKKDLELLVQVTVDFGFIWGLSGLFVEATRQVKLFWKEVIMKWNWNWMMVCLSPFLLRLALQGHFPWDKQDFRLKLQCFDASKNENPAAFTENGRQMRLEQTHRV